MSIEKSDYIDEKSEPIGEDEEQKWRAHSAKLDGRRTDGHWERNDCVHYIDTLEESLRVYMDCAPTTTAAAAAAGTVERQRERESRTNPPPPPILVFGPAHHTSLTGCASVQSRAVCYEEVISFSLLLFYSLSLSPDARLRLREKRRERDCSRPQGE